jgi:hypothetical protein
VQDIKQYKKDCLLDEHRSLSAYVEQEVVATALCRTLAAAAWIIGMLGVAGTQAGPLSIALVVFPGLIALWVVDVYFSYVGVVYKVRRLGVRQMIADLPTASDETVSGWATPINPFDGADKKSALRDAALSPWVLLPYAVLEFATLVNLLLG